MPIFVPQRISSSSDFDIKRSSRGYWIVRDRDGLIGGTFLTSKDALRFALFETGGDSARVHTLHRAGGAGGSLAGTTKPRSAAAVSEKKVPSRSGAARWPLLATRRGSG